MLPDDDKRYAIETCRSSESVLKKWFKINGLQLVHLLVVWWLVNLQDARCNNKDNILKWVKYYIVILIYIISPSFIHKTHRRHEWSITAKYSIQSYMFRLHEPSSGMLYKHFRTLAHLQYALLVSENSLVFRY